MKKFLSTIALLSAVIMIAVCCVACGDDSKKSGGSSDQDIITFSHDGSTYYASPYVFKLNGSGDPSIVTAEYSTNARIYSSRSCKTGDAIYTNNGFEMELDRYVITGSDTMRKEVFMSASELASVDFAGGGVDNWYARITCLGADSDYLYFNILPYPDTALTQGPVLYKMGRISLSSKSIEEISGVSACDFVLDGSWIYYIDNGFYFDDTTGLSGKVDLSRMGVYKVRTDGSDRTLVRILHWAGEDDSSPSHSAIGDSLKLIDGKLYYIDNSAEGKSRVCRMSLSGSDVEYVTAEPASCYAVDTDHNAVYYLVGRYEDMTNSAGYMSAAPELRKSDLSAPTDEEIPISAYGYIDMDYADGYVYFTSNSYQYARELGERPDSISGHRMNVGTRQFQKLIGYNDSEIVKVRGDDGRIIIKEVKEGTDHLYWEDTEAKYASERK